MNTIRIISRTLTRFHKHLFNAAELALTGFLLCAAGSAVAQPTNAWQITDDSSAGNSVLYYETNLTANQQMLAASQGWRCRVVCRLVDDFGGLETMFCSYDAGTNRYAVYWDFDASGNLVAHLDGLGTFTLLTNNTHLYHTNEIVYSPDTRTATYYLDQVAITNWAGMATTDAPPTVAWGAGSGPGQGQMNFNNAQFIIAATNGIAGYDAGNSGIPPNPVTQGWTTVPSAIVGTTNLPAAVLPVLADDPTASSLIVTTLADSGPGSLRDAVAFANTNQGSEVINFASALSGQTIVLTNGQITITGPLTINALGLGNGIEISANRGASPVLDITSNAVVSMDFLTIKDGPLYSPPIQNGDPIGQTGTLALNGCRFVGNAGGGVDNEGTLAVNNCDFSGNGSGGSGGAINNAGKLLVNGSIFSENSAGYGGAILNGAPIGNGATLTVNHCIFTGNAASYGAAVENDNAGVVILNDSILSGNTSPGGYGGGILNDGTLYVSNCTFSGNGDDAYVGGAIENDYGAALTLKNSTFLNNSANGGGAIDNSGALLVHDCLFADNVATAVRGVGGAIQTAGTSAPVNIYDSFFSSNSADGFGGAIDNVETLTIEDCTFSFNSAVEGGGAVENDTTLIANNCTFYGNSSGNGGAIDNSITLKVNNCTIYGNLAQNQGGGISSYGSLFLNNSIVAGNTAPYGPNIWGSISGANNITNGDPHLAPLGYYGGPTPTMPPLSGSPAIGAGDSSIAGALATDERGYPRISGGAVDIGAVEAQYAPTNNPPHLTDSTLSAAGNAFQSVFTDVPDADFSVLASTNPALPLTNWMVLGPAREISPGQYEFTDPGAANSAQRFYRIVSP